MIALRPPAIGVALLLFAAGAAWAASAQEIRTAASGNVRARISYTPVNAFSVRNVRLTIVRAGKTVLDRRLRGGDRPVTLLVRDLERDAEPEVIADRYTGGAHCCTYSLVYRYDEAARLYRLRRHNWGNYGYRLQDVDADRAPEFRTSDDRFAGRFTAYAASVPPIQIWSYRAGRFLDVTRRHPKLVRADAAELWRTYLRVRRMRGDVRGVLASYLADTYLLGTPRLGWRRVMAAYRRGELRALRGDTSPAGRRYLRILRRFLAAAGYARARRL